MKRLPLCVVDIDAAVEEKPHEILLVGKGGVRDRCGVLRASEAAALDVNVGSMVEQEAHHVRNPVHAKINEPARPERIAYVRHRRET